MLLRGVASTFVVLQGHPAFDRCSNDAQVACNRPFWDKLATVCSVPFLVARLDSLLRVQHSRPII